LITVNVRRRRMNPNNNKNFNDEALRINRKLKRESDEIYEHVFGDDASNSYTHQELIIMLDEIYDCYKYVVDNIYSKGQHIGDRDES
jgi:hypothetical protein